MCSPVRAKPGGRDGRGRNMNRRVMLAILAALTAFGAAFAMAASLGTISSDSLGASNTTVASCDTNGVTTDYTTAWDATDKRYEVSAVVVSGIAAACDLKEVAVTVTDSSGASLASGTATYTQLTDLGSKTVSLSSGVASSALEGIHVQISG